MRRGKRAAAFLLSALMASCSLGGFVGCGDGGGMVDAVQTPAPSLVVGGAYSVGDEDPTITVVMQEGDFRAGIVKEDITLAGSFEKLNVLSVETIEDVLMIETEGTIVENASLQGMVTLENAFGTGSSGTASADVAMTVTYIDADSYRYEEVGPRKRLTFQIVSADPFTAGAADPTHWKLKKFQVADGEVSVVDSDFSVAVDSVSEAKDEATVAIALTEGTAEEIERFNGLPLFVDGAAFGSGEEKILFVSPAPAMVDLYVRAVNFDDVSGECRYRMHLAAEGDFLGLTRDKIAFSDDALTIEEFGESTDGGYDLVLLKTEKDEGAGVSRNLHATATLAAGTVALPCGAVNGEPVAAEIAYEDMSEVRAVANGPTGWQTEPDGEYYVDRVKDLLMSFYNFAGAIKNSLDSQGGGPIGAVQGVFSGASALLTTLEMCGVFPRGVSLENVYYSVMQVQSMVRELGNQMQALYDHMDERLDNVEQQQYRIVFNSAQSNWNAFRDGIYKEMKAKIEAFQSAYNTRFIQGFLNHADTYVHTVKYEKIKDQEGNDVLSATLDGVLANRGLMGGEIDGSKTVAVQLPGGLPETIGRLAMEGAMYADFEKDLQQELADKYFTVTRTDVSPTEKEREQYPYLDRAMQVNGTLVPFYDYYDTLRLTFIKEAVDYTGAQSYLSTYLAYCDAVAGNGGNSPLDYFTTMMGACYNFFPEAKDQIACYNADLLDLSNRASTLAYFMQTLSGLTSGVTVQTLDNATAKVSKELDRQKALYETKAQESITATKEQSAALHHGKIYSFVTQSFLYAEERQVVIYTDWDEKGNTAKQDYGYLVKRTNDPNDDSLGQGVYAQKMTDNRIRLDKVREIANRMAASETEKTYERFTEYLSDFAGMGVGGKECTKRILCGTPVFTGTSAQNTLTCIGVDSNHDNYYFKADGEYAVNANASPNGHKYEAKYFRTHIVLTGDIYDHGAQSNATLLELATYCEDHWYWRREEIAAFAGGKCDAFQTDASKPDPNLKWAKVGDNFRVRAFVTMECQVILQSAKGDPVPEN